MKGADITEQDTARVPARQSYSGSPRADVDLDRHERFPFEIVGEPAHAAHMDVSHLRQDYKRPPVNEEDLLPDPMDQFASWFVEAETQHILEPNAMILATVDERGQPFTRTVLAKSFDSSGFTFFTNTESRKAQHIAHNARVSLLFLWLPLERQVSINGQADKLSTGDTLKYFISRPLGSRLGAWVSPQSQVISSRSLLEAKFEEMKRKFSDGEIPLPSFWGGYKVRPETMEFWQGGRDRLHDRFLYSRENSGWTVHRLAP